MQWNRVEGPFQIRVTAAKGQARAGTVIAQYLSRAVAAKPGAAASTRAVAVPGRSHGKWVWIALVAAGTAVGGGLAAGLVKSSKTTSSATSTAATPALTVGVPIITVGKP
jgi:hypothetical protein